MDSSLLDHIAFAWSYDKNLASKLYRPSVVFKNFAFKDLLDEKASCVCASVVRFHAFLDPATALEVSDGGKPEFHVRTMDTRIIQHPGLRHALAQGLNHIPIRKTDFRETVEVVSETFTQLFHILHLTDFHLQLPEAIGFLTELCLKYLRLAAKQNKYGFKTLSPHLFAIPAVSNEVDWLLKHIFISGLDKATNNASFMCVRHIRLQALQRLSGEDFCPCKNNGIWRLQTSIFDSIRAEILEILPESPIAYNALPFLMATFKQHKAKYRWLTNAFQTVYSNIAKLLTIATMEVLEPFKIWAKRTIDGYANFLKVKTSIYWIIDSVMQVTLNLPENMHEVYVADITRCYESIPLHGKNNLLDALKFVLKIGFKQARTQHPKAVTNLWIKTDTTGTPTTAQWSTTQPRSNGWFQLSENRLISLHGWLMTNCFVTLGDRVWQQVKGIPMGFSCSPLWCNLYLLSFEVRFIQRLASLRRYDLMARFQFAFRYIDDICWINVHNPQEFLSPDQPQCEDNPFWIYPLDVLEIKHEVEEFSPTEPDRGIKAHFMNVQFTVDLSKPDNFNMRKFDKRRKLPFKYTQFIKFQSNRPVKQSYNMIISQILPILYTSNDTDEAIREILSLVRILKENGFQESRLKKISSQWLTSGSFPATKVNIQQIIMTLSHPNLES